MKVVRLEDFAKELGDLGDSQINMLKEITYNALLRSIPLLVQASPVDTGQYASSWAVERTDEDRMSIGNYAPHAGIIEYGARPFTPPLAPLLEWARRVIEVEGTDAQVQAIKGPPKDPETGRSVESTVGRPMKVPIDAENYSPEVRRLALSVQAKIRAVGIRPRHILENMIPKIIEHVIADFKRESESNG